MGLLQNKVYRTPDHRYLDNEGKEYISCTKFMKMFEPEFDSQTISMRVAKARGISQADVLKEWEGKKDASIVHGTRVHNALERYAKEFKILPEDEDLEPMIKSVIAEYNDYYQTFDEEVLYTKYGIAGTADKILFVSKGTTGQVDVEDFKTNLSKGIEPFSKYKNYYSEPLSHLHHCNFAKVSLQMSMYGYMMEEMTGKKIRTLWLRYIPPNQGLAHVRIPIPYMKKEIEALIEYYLTNYKN